MSKLVVYIASVSGNVEIKKKQQKITMILESKKIEFETVDIAASQDAKDRMRQLVGNPTALPPQICNGDVFCGTFEEFEQAIEDERLEEFLKL